MSKTTKDRIHKEKIISIGYHHEDEHQTFSDALTCLSHALEAVGMPSDIEHHHKLKLEELIYEAFAYGELVENMYFGGEWDVLNKDKKNEI